MTRGHSLLVLVLLFLAGCGGDPKKPSVTPPDEIDTTPPGQVVDLAGSLTNDSTITLTWTAPGDDDSSGAADRYDVRWSTQLLTDQSWPSAHRCDGLPEPSNAGSVESHPVTGLPRNTPVRLALKAIDEADNASPISNVVHMQLPSATPACSLSVVSLDFGSLAPPLTADLTFTITNVGGGRLQGDVGIEGERFTLVDGSGPFSLGYRESHAATVRFMPEIPGPAQGSVTLGLDGCGSVPCGGRGSGPYCIMDWDTLQFGSVNVGDHRSWRVTPTNRGDHWTVVTPLLEGCTGMRVPYDQSFTLQPGDSRSIGVDSGPWSTARSTAGSS